MIQRYLLYANGPDQVGIVAAVTKPLAALNCNLEDSRMTILHGQFSIMMVICVDRAISDDAVVSHDSHEGNTISTKALIENSLAQTAQRFGLYISLVPLADFSSELGQESTKHISGEEDDYLCVSVHGADRIGILSSIAEQIADSGASVVDLATRLVDNGYVLVMTIALSKGISVENLSNNLNRVASDLGVSCNISSAAPDVL